MRVGWAGVFAVLGVQLLCQSGYPKGDALHRASAITCTEGGSDRVSMRSTDRLPEASGTARVERRGGTTDIEIELTSMKPAMLFGGDYNTYVLWIVPPRGRAENLGEVLLHGDRATHRASTPATTFAILISAEPHYLVSSPSAFLILENKPDPQGRAIDQPLVVGVYNFARSTLADQKEAKGRVNSEVRQAFTAVRLAERAGAENFANEELASARRALQDTLALWKERKDRTEIAAQARETVRLAVAAQHLAQERALLVLGSTEGVGGGKGETEGRDARGGSSYRR